MYNLFQQHLERVPNIWEGTPISSLFPIEIFNPKYSKQNTWKIREYFHIHPVLLHTVTIGKQNMYMQAIWVSSRQPHNMNIQLLKMFFSDVMIYGLCFILLFCDNLIFLW